MARNERSHGRLHTSSSRRPWQYSLLALFVLTTVVAVLLSIGVTFPQETFIVLGLIAMAAVAVVLYVSELVVLGWIIDLPAWLAERAMPAAHVPLECEQVGEILVVKLSDNIASRRECRSVKEQLDRLIADDHFDIVLDFSSIKKLASGFRDVLLHATRVARTQAEKQGKPYYAMDLPPGATFRVFDDREQAISAMGRHAGLGWVVLCGVPVGIRAVSE